jgi:acyl carrier protein
MPTETAISLDDALDLLATIFEEPRSNIHPATLREDIEGWDSLGELSLMAEFDERFGIALDSDTLENFKSVDDLLQVLKDNGLLSA